MPTNVWEKLNETSGIGSVASTIAGFAVPPLSAKHTNEKAISRWNAGKTVPKQSTLSRDVINAVEAYISAKNGTPVRNCALLHISNDEVSAEFQNPVKNTLDVVCYNAENGLLHASRRSATGNFSALSPIGRNSKETVASLLFAILPSLIKKNSEVEDDLRILTSWYPTCKQSNGVVVFTQEAEFALRRICDAFYWGIKERKLMVTSIDQFGNIPTLDKGRLAAKSYDGIILLGEPSVLNEAESNTSTTTNVKLTVATAKMMFEKEREKSLASLSPKQREEVPEAADDIMVPSWVIKFIRAFYDTRGTKVPFVNFRIEGGTGTGKSFGVQLMAAIMGKPLKTMNLNPDTDKIDLKDQIIPNTSSTNGFVIQKPDFDDLINDPAAFYYDVTGIEKPDATPAECQAAYDMAMDSGAQFRHILSPIMEGLQGPYIIEIQEMSRARAGVLSGLNEIFDRGGMIHLEGAGEQFRRSPDAIVVSTDNYAYPGCKPLSPDNRRRFNLKSRLPSLSASDAVMMAAQQTQFKDLDLLTRMWNIVKEVATYCNEQHIRSGDVGLSELIDWTMMVKLGRSRFESFVDCVVNSATGDDTEQDAVTKHVITSATVGRFFDDDTATDPLTANTATA